MRRHTLRTVKTALTLHDKGSGTMMGIILVMCAGIVALGIVCAGSYLISAEQARNVSQEVALDIAQRIQISELERGTTALSENVSAKQKRHNGNNTRVFSEHKTLCEQAGKRVSERGMSVLQCVIEGQEAQVRIEAIPSVNFLPHPTAVSRAGPAQCSAQSVPRNR